nr:MAG TPA: hypothetical protein [Caudoviricetes sp.]
MNTISNIGLIQNRLNLLHKLSQDVENYLSNNNINQGFLYVHKDGIDIVDPLRDNPENHLNYLPSYYFKSYKETTFEDLASLMRYASNNGNLDSGFGIGIYNKSGNQYFLMTPQDTLVQQDIDNSGEGDFFYDVSKNRYFSRSPL